ncbi:nucleotide-binding protein [candidate division NPL-UPA2 bacterium]|nr:nucleotide-binding protein [candidate division NPL-UPA2 bacterium]
MGGLKPKIFVASSVEGLNIAYAIQENLENVGDVTVWPQGIFDLSEYALDDLIKQLDIFDFGIFVFAFEDLAKIRNEEVKTTRDNVIFELGLFVGRMGRQRCFILMPKNKEGLHLPTDLLGIKPAFYDPNKSDANLLAALGPASNQIRRSINRQGLRKRKEAELSNAVVQQIVEAGVTAFYQSRKDYGKYRADTATIDSYIATANHSLHMVSINLMTGIPFDDMCSVLEKKLKQNNTFSVCLSLLNPLKNELIAVISSVLNMKPEKLAKTIEDSLSNLFNLKQKLSMQEQDRFEIKVHNALPFGSAIIIDGDTEKGKIQIETKPYKASLRKSFAFEISNKGNNELYITLRDCYFRLIKEGVTYESIQELLIRRNTRRIQK